MTWQTICLRDIKPAPWRNGGGTTRELLAWPNSVSWQWRASVAEVVQSGQFSSFAGVQRWFAVLEGNGVCLSIDGQQHRLTGSDKPLAFDGALRTTCELLDGATQDFNLMVQSGVAARMLRIHGSYTATANAPEIIAVYPHDTKATVQIGNETHALLPHTFGWAKVDINTSIQVHASNALLMEIDV